MSVLLLFVDGIGIGEYDERKNPFARFPVAFFPQFLDRCVGRVPHDGVVVATDPTMGVAGLPQSGTGQAALFTGENTAQLVGHHVSGFPSPTLRKIIREKSIFLQLESMHRVATFANALSASYLQRSDRMISASTWSVRASSFPLRTVERELIEGRALSHDLTNEFLAEMGHKVPIFTPQESAEILVQIVASVDFCLFEFILTDMIGHRQDMAWAEKELEKLHQFLSTLLDRIDLTEHLVVLASDHGNFEDLSVSTHTRHHVPTVLWGREAMPISRRIRRIEDIPRAILNYLKCN